jgi:transketolase
VRNAFLEGLVALAERDERVMLLTGDLGFAVLEPFAQRFPDRFVNCGVAEQNMTGVATGLAEAGMIPFTYSIATFATLRPYEFIRNGPALHSLPVRIIGVGGGFDYGHNGITHFALEDYAVMRTQPAMGVIAPADGQQARAALEATAEEPGPMYFRISKAGTALPGLDGRFRLGRAEMIGDGNDAAIISIGSISHAAVAARDLLRERGIDTTVAVVSSLNPEPVDDLAELIGAVGVAVTVEAHYRNGGLGSAVGELIAERGLKARLHRAAVDKMPIAQTGSQAFLEDRYGLSPHGLAQTVEEALGE